MDELTLKLLEIKTQMDDAKLKMSDNKFSTMMLAKSSRYMSYLRATGHAPAIEAMVHLYIRLDDLADSHRAEGNTSVAKQIGDMAASLWNTIRKTVLVMEPKRRNEAHTQMVNCTRQG